MCPVVLDYSPIGAVGQLAGQVGANRNFEESQNLGIQQQQAQSALQTAALQRQEMQQQMAAQQQRMAMESQQQNQQQPAQGGFGGGIGGGMPGAMRIAGADGNTYVGTPQQAAQMRNLAHSGITDPDQLAAATKQILGVPNLMPVTDENGNKVFVPPGQALPYGWHAANVQTAQERAKIAAQALADREAALTSTQKYRDTTLQLERDKMNAAAGKVGDANFFNGIKTDQKAADDAVSSAQFDATRADRELTEARSTVAEVEVDTKQDPTKPDSPAVQHAKDAWSTAKAKSDAASADVVAAQKARDDLHARQKQAIASRLSGNAPAAQNQGLGTPAPAAQPQGFSPKVGDTATGPNGQKLVWNGQGLVPAQ